MTHTDSLNYAVEAGPMGAIGSPPSPEQRLARTCLSNTAGWLFHGATRVFLQDADALAMKLSDLGETLQYLKGYRNLLARHTHDDTFAADYERTL
jgi:hypothetical protein